MKLQRQQSIDWWNSLGNTKRNDLALDYYGSTLVMDDEIEFIFLREVPQEKLYNREEVVNFGNKIREYCKDGWKSDSLHKVFFEWDEFIKENL